MKESAMVSSTNTLETVGSRTIVMRKTDSLVVGAWYPDYSNTWAKTHSILPGVQDIKNTELGD